MWYDVKVDHSYLPVGYGLRASFGMMFAYWFQEGHMKVEHTFPLGFWGPYLVWLKVEHYVARFAFIVIAWNLPARVC